MSRTWLPLSVVLLALASPAPAADKAPAGTWKATIALPGGAQDPLWLVKIEEKAGAWTGKVLAASEEMPRCELVNLSVKNNVLSLVIKVGDVGRVSFEGSVPAKEDA